MKRVLFAWELGAGMGHLLPHVMLLKKLHEAGYEIHAAVKDLSKIVKAFGDIPCAYWQAPARNRPTEDKYTPTFTFNQILHNIGMGDVEDLTARILAWRNLIQAIKPTVIIADYAPTLLLALRGESVPCHGMNTGFFFPPNIAPQQVFSVFNTLPEGINLVEHEQKLLGNINECLRKTKLPRLDSVASLFARINHRWLMTIPELDHYGTRHLEHYLGISEPNKFQFPGWPTQSQHKIFCYLKPFPALEKLLEYLSRQDASVVIASDGLPASLLQKFTSEKLKFSLKPLDLQLVSQGATLAITNASHATAGYLLLRGVPQISIPLGLEQELLAARIDYQKWGITLNAKHKGEVPDFLADPRLQRNQTYVADLTNKHQPVASESYFHEVINLILTNRSREVAP